MNNNPVVWIWDTLDMFSLTEVWALPMLHAGLEIYH